MLLSETSATSDTSASSATSVVFSPTSSLETSGRLMEFDSTDGKLRVHYSDRLVALLREVRQLSALGLTVPAKIISTAQTAQKFYRHGVVLKQVGGIVATLYMYNVYVNTCRQRHIAPPHVQCNIM